MSTPVFVSKSTAQLREERNEILRGLAPLTINQLRTMRADSTISYEHEILLDRYENLTWLIADED